MSVTEVADSWLLSKQGEVKKSTHGYYKEVAGIFIQRDNIGTKTVRNNVRKTLTAGAYGLTRSKPRPMNP